MEDVLRELTLDDVNKIKEDLKKEWPRNICHFYFIENYLKWKKRCPETEIKFFDFNDSKSTSNLIAYLPDQNYVVVSITRNYSNFWEKLFKTKLIDFKSGTTFGALHMSQRESLISVIDLNGYSIEYEVKSKLHFLSCEEAINFEFSLPSGFKINKLTSDHSSMVNSLWPYRFDGSFKFIDDMIRHNGGSVLVNATNEEVCWALHNNYGALGILQTSPDHRRKGYGKIISKAVCQQIASLGMDVCAVNSEGNISEYLLKDLGFQEIDRITWIKLNIKI